MAESDKKNSLVSLTKGFISLLACSGGGEVDLADAEKTLNTTKRRLYDVANVLAGVGLVEKCGKSKVRWTGEMTSIDGDLSTNVASLSEREQEIDQMLSAVDREIAELNASEFFQNYAWVSDKDVLKLVPEDDITLFALKGPKSLTVTVQEQEGDQPFKLICRATDGEIDLIQIGKTGSSNK